MFASLRQRTQNLVVVGSNLKDAIISDNTFFLQMLSLKEAKVDQVTATQIPKM
jgi:hypothetical protein